MSKKIEREVLALIELRQIFHYEPLTTEGLASCLHMPTAVIKHIVWGLWMDEKIKALQEAKGSKRKWILP